ncbi:MAG TPA: hypothetical protein VEW71_02155 [Allosphingosinicella sp.]|nr:hypothetical protein [Allosphingosinicella sp.]
MIASRRHRPATAAFGALVALAAGAAPASAQWSDSATLDGATAATAAPAPVERDYIVGAWTDSDDCAAAVAFAGDGTFATADGGAGLWGLDGTELVLAGAGGVRTLRITPVDQDTMEMVNEDGSRGTSTRCEPDGGGNANFVARDIA